MSISFRRLRAFVTVARTQSVTEAARELSITPPAVTKSVRELETFLKADLFIRASSGLTLTVAGEAFLLYAKRSLAEIEHGLEEVGQMLGGTGGRVSVGATAEAANYILPLAISRLIRQRSQIEISLRGGTFEALAREVRAGDLDLFVAIAPQQTPSGLISEPIYKDELIVIARPGHPLTGQSGLQLANLQDVRWINATGYKGLEQLMRKSFEEAQVAYPQNTIVVEQLGAMRAILQNTDLVAATTRMRVRQELDEGLLVTLPVTLSHTTHEISVLRREDAHVSSSTKQLLSFLRSVAAQAQKEA